MNLIHPGALALDACLSELSSTVSRCKFEASDSSGDEVTLLKIMTVIQDCMCNPVGDNLGDIEVCEMLETVLTTCCQMRLSGGSSHHTRETEHHVLTSPVCEEILRRSAEATMHALVKTAFARLYTLDPEEEERKLADNGSTSQDLEGKMTVTTEASDRPEPPPEGEVGDSELSPQPPSAIEQPLSPSGPRAKCEWYSK